MDGPIDYLSGIGVLPDPLGAINKQIAFGLDAAQKQAETQQLGAEAAATAQKLNRAQMFQQDLAAVQKDPSAQNVSSLVMKYPEFGDQVKAGWDLKDKATADSDLTQLGEVYTAAAAGNWQLAAKQAQARIDADKAAGQADDGDQAMLGQINAAAGGDPKAQKAVLATLGTHIAAVSGPEHFASVFGALKGGYTLDAGATRYDENGNIIAQSPFLKVGDGIAERDGANGSPATAAPAQAPASTPGGEDGFDSAVAFTLKHEGGYNPHDMNGAPVNMGINQGANPDLDVKNLTPDEAKAVYKTRYWDKSGAAKLPAAMQTPYFDTYVINPSRAKQFLKASGGDPAKFVQLRQNWMSTVAAKNPQYAKAYASRNADLQLTVAGGQPQASSAAPSAGDPPTGYHWVVPPSASPDQFRTLTPAEVTARKLDATQQYQLNTKTGALTNLGKIDASGQDVLAKYGIPESMTGPDVLSKLPANIASQVKALAEGRLPMPSSFALAKPYWQTMLQLTAQYDPAFDAANAPARKAAITSFTGTGKGAMLVGSINRVANHMDLLWNESKKLAGPSTGFGPLDTALATTGQAFERPDAKAYDTEVTFVAGELGKLAKAGIVTEGETDKIINNLSRTNSAKTREAAIQAAVGIISGAVDPLKDQYNSAFTNDSTRPKIPWVTPKAQSIFSKIGGVDLSLTGAGAGGNAPVDTGAPVHVSSPQEAAKLPPGTLFITPDGRTLRKK